MIGWILYHLRPDQLTPDEDYSVIRLIEAAKQRNITLEIYTPDQFELVVSRNDQKSILLDGKPTPIPDFLIPRLGSTTPYFGLAIIRQLERLGVYVCNSSTTIETVKDKMHMHQILAQSKLPTPKTMLLKFPVDIAVVKREIGFPIIIKNISGKKGAGIYLCQTEDQFADLMELIQTNNNKASIILQEYISTSHGKDLRIFLIGGKVVGGMKRSSQTSFKANFSRGGTVENVTLTPEIEWLATESARLVGLDIAGIDLLFDTQGYKICEANSAPGFKGLEKVHGKVIAEQILDYITARVQGTLHEKNIVEKLMEKEVTNF